MDYKPSVFVIGSCIIDNIVYTRRFPAVGESLVGIRVMSQIGGKASNQAIAIARLGGNVKLLVRTGADEWAKMASKLWQDEGVDVSNVICDQYLPTGMGIVVVDENGQNYTLSVLGANELLSLNDIDRAESAIRQSRVLSLHLNPPLETVSHALQLAKRFKMITLLNASPIEALSSELLSLIDLLILNQTEASSFLGFEVNDYQSAYLAGEELIKLGSRATIISLGRKGLILVTPTEKHLIPAFEVEAIDTTGAGDALTAGLAVCLAEGYNILFAAHFACAVSAISVSRMGTWTSMPSRVEVNNFLSKHRNTSLLQLFSDIMLQG